MPEVDGARIISSGRHELLRKVPEPLVQVGAQDHPPHASSCHDVITHVPLMIKCVVAS